MELPVRETRDDAGYPPAPAVASRATSWYTKAQDSKSTLAAAAFDRDNDVVIDKTGVIGGMNGTNGVNGRHDHSNHNGHNGVHADTRRVCEDELVGESRDAVYVAALPPSAEELRALRRKMRSECRNGQVERSEETACVERQWQAFKYACEERSTHSGHAGALRRAQKSVLPVVSASRLSNGNSPENGFHENAAGDPAKEGGESKAQFMTRDELQRMRDEMKYACQQRKREQVRRRSEMDGECPLLLGCRLRRMLEFVLRFPPLEGGSGRSAMHGALLDDAVALVIAALVVCNGFAPGVVQYFLQDTPRLKAPLQGENGSVVAIDAGELYFEILERMRNELKDEPPSGVEWCGLANGLLRMILVPARLDLSVLRPLALADLRGEASAGGPSGGVPQPGRSLRSWFGPDEQSQPYTIRRKIHMTDLPIYQKKRYIMETVCGNQVTLLQGETGSGKTTQVPQYILEATQADREAGRPVRIVCTQPRRIAAITVAKRVAEELGETVGEGVVGYKIRGTSVVSPKCQVLFCTTGVLLRRLNQEGTTRMFSEKTCTHLLVDEVHERSCDTDFMLTFLRDVLHLRPDIKVVLMSATMDAECFLRYFSASMGGREPPFMQVSGRQFPTHEVFLDTINNKLGRTSPAVAKSPDDLRKETNDFSESDGIDYELISEILKEIASSDRGAWSFVRDSADGVSLECPADPTTGSVLIFMPGAGEISQMVAMITESGCPDTWWVLPLHGGLPADEQQDAFKTKFPAGKTWKIIVATNVAETSVTVPDITVVIDSCRERRTGIDKYSNTPQLKEQWCALDSMKQRRGRAGRVQPGVCLRIIPEKFIERLESKTPPEMQRVCLENIYLQVCASGVDDRSAFLAKTPDPPEDNAILFARVALQELGALDDSQKDGLTPLGRHLAALPCHPRLGKILILGCLLSVPGPVLSICAAMTSRSPLMTTQDSQKRSAWQAARNELMRNLGHRSDHCIWAILMHAFHSEGVVRFDLCKRYGLSYERMSAASFERKHLAESLIQAGFLKNDFFEEEFKADNDPVPDWTVVRAAVTGGLFPNIVHVERSAQRGGATPSGGQSLGEKNKWLRYSIQQRHVSNDSNLSFPKSVNMHPNSLCFGQDQFHCPWLAYFTLQQTTKLYVYDVSEVNPWGLLLFGAEPKFNERSGQFEVGGWARFRCQDGPQILPLIQAARRALRAVLAKKLRDSTYDCASSAELAACKQLLKTNGLGYEPRSDVVAWPLVEELRAEAVENSANVQMAPQLQGDASSATLSRAPLPRSR